MNKIVLISPVRNEEDYLRITIESILKQSLKPVEWILVNDGSIDKTEEIIDEYTSVYPWIKKVNNVDRGYYYPGTGVVSVFNLGYNKIETPDWDYVVKLDTDLWFDETYFENLIAEFENNPKLGIASGCTYLPIDGDLIREPTQEDHPVGPCKVYKRACWEQIGGLLPVPGWDLADLLSAQMNGWETRCFVDLKITHYRLTGSRRKGKWAPKFLQGRFTYRHGYNFFYMVFKELYHIFHKPVIIGTFAQITGYIYAFLNQDEFLFPKDMRKYLRGRHKQFLLRKFRLSK